jgi:hypothetical protein
MGYTPCGVRPSRVKVVWPTWAFWPEAKQGNPPVPHQRAACRLNPADRQRVAGGGGAKDLSLEMGVPIWGIGSEGAHRGGLAAAKQVSGWELATAGRRRGGGRRLMGRRAAQCQGGGDGGSP